MFVSRDVGPGPRAPGEVGLSVVPSAGENLGRLSAAGELEERIGS